MVSCVLVPGMKVGKQQKWHHVLLKTMCHSLSLSGFAYFAVMIRALPPSEASFQIDNFVIFQVFEWVTHSFLFKLKSLCESGHLIQSRNCPLANAEVQRSLGSACTESTPVTEISIYALL